MQPLPYNIEIGRELTPYSFISVHGLTQPGEVAIVNLSADARGENATQIALHCSIRYKDNLLVLNTKNAGEWQKEERHKINLKAGDFFDVHIRPLQDKFEVYISRALVATFEHRQPLNSITHLFVDGTITLRSCDVVSSEPCALPYTRQLDYWRGIHIWGIANGIFQIDLKNSAGDTVMHFNPRFNEKIVVRNAQRNGQWGTEERAGDFPFEKNKVFDVLIDEHQRGTFAVSVNGELFCAFQNRGMGEVTALNMHGELSALLAVEITR